MSDLKTTIRDEIEDLHVFFVNWWTGVAPRDQLEARFGQAMDAALVFVSPDGERLDRAGLMKGLSETYGANPGLNIAIRDVQVVREIGDLVLVTFTDWHRGSVQTKRPDTGRFTTALMTRATPHRWLHVHETWLPEAEQAAGPYDF